MTYIDPEDRSGAGAVSARGVRILLVAARASLVEPVRTALKADAAMRLRLCTDAREAAGMVRQWRPDAVLLDPALAPRIGQRLIERLRAEPATRATAVVVLGDASDERTRAAVGRIGADGATAPPEAPGFPRSLRRAIAARGEGSPATG